MPDLIRYALVGAAAAWTLLSIRKSAYTIVGMGIAASWYLLVTTL